MKTPFKSLGLLITICTFVSCKVDPTPPVLSTTSITEISTSSAVSGGTITDDGGAAIISEGVCWNTVTDPTIENSKTSEPGGSLSFTSNISQLLPNTSYYVRAYAVNIAGTSYGNSISFKTLGDKPGLASNNASEILTTSASLNGTVNPNSSSTAVTFEWGTTTSYGNTLTPSQSSVTGSTSVNISANLSGLTPGTTYHFRINATNELGTTQGDDMTFTTLGKLPEITILNATNIQIVSATIKGSVNPNYLSSTVTFEWGTTTSYGNTIALSQNPIEGNTSVDVVTDLSGLSPETTYHFRIKATNELGTSTSGDKTLTTYAVIDIDNNLYHSVTIGSQTWMKENLKTTKYTNGDLIGTTSTPTFDITAESTPKYQWPYDGDINNVVSYGRLYTWYVATDNRNVCPRDWHVPSEAEQMVLTNYLGGQAIAGGKLKESGTTHWLFPTADATNSSLFTALPGGLRFIWGQYLYKGSIAFFWSTTDRDVVTGNDLYLNRDNNSAYHSSFDKNIGMSIRCIKD